MKRHAHKIFDLILFISLFTISTFCIIGFSIAQPKISTIDSHGLPVVNLNLNNTNLETIHFGGTSIKYPGNDLELLHHGTVTTYKNIELKGRGNSSWAAAQRSYQIKFAEQKVDLLGLGPAKKLILNANFYDSTPVRNALAAKISTMLEMPYTRPGEFIEFYVNGEYIGIYYLHHKIEIAKNSVNLTDPAGVIVELDNLHNYNENCYTTHSGTCLTFKDSVSAVNTPTFKIAASDFIKNFNQLELAAASGDYETIKNLIDIDSFAKYYLISEISNDPDGYASSFYFYKNGFTDQIHAGPIWDYDYAFGNQDYPWPPYPEFFNPDQFLTRRPEAFGDKDTPADFKISKLIYQLIDIPEFKARVADIYQASIQDRFTEIERFIRQTTSKLAPVLAAKPTAKSEDDTTTYDQHVENLISWLSTRFEHLDVLYGSKY
ncbi:CotH kinase family protein [Candidatus Saccharibacteria bacterium]|nr:CotH kinase family protein [Candidatus Saccharibacteria bacterium]